MVARTIKRIFLVALVALASCVEPFDIPVRNDQVNFLVIDGYINTQTQTATVVLSRAVPLSKESAFPRESGAAVTIEEENGTTYTATAQGNGVYKVTDPAFQNNKQFRLRVRTQDAKEYASTFITPRSAPPITGIDWTPESDGLTVRIDSEDPTNSTQYYRWEYVETWRYESQLSSEFKLENGKAITRIASEQLKTCYRSENSERIVVGTTVGLANNKLTQQAVVFVPSASPKTKMTYSALVKQYALSKDAYEYWEQLRTNTESLGGLFDPQPGEIRGNISGVDDPTEPVIGYFDGGSFSEKRIFIEFKDLPAHLRVVAPLPLCPEYMIDAEKVHEVGGSYMLTHGIYERTALVAYMYTSNDCADCTLLGGTTIKPDFWPY